METLVQLSSADYSTVPGDSAANFRNVLSSPIILDINKKYVISVVDVFIPIKQTPTVTKSIFVNIDIVEAVIVGSAQTQSILFIPFTLMEPYDGSMFWYQTNGFNKWYPISKYSIPNIRVSFTMSDGNLIPYGVGDYSYITISIKEVY